MRHSAYHLPARSTGLGAVLVLLSCAWAQSAQAHHVMGYATPATALEGLLAGLGHPVIGLDHLLFVVGAGVLAARVERGMLLPLAFVVASTLMVGLRVSGLAMPVGEIWVAASLLVLGAAMLIVRTPGRVAPATLFVLAGAVHGYALAEGIVGAESAPVNAYLAGLMIVQCAIAFAAWAAATWAFKARPAFDLYRMTGAAVGVAGLYFTVTALMG